MFLVSDSGADLRSGGGIQTPSLANLHLINCANWERESLQEVIVLSFEHGHVREQAEDVEGGALLQLYSRTPQ